jgi:hypothetical protein
MQQSPWGINLTPVPYKTSNKSIHDAYSVMSGGGLENMMAQFDVNNGEQR